VDEDDVDVVAVVDAREENDNVVAEIADDKETNSPQ
jgi:hypothetical protein